VFAVFLCIIKRFKTLAMKKNVGSIDKAVRILVAVVIAILYFTNHITGFLGLALLVFAAIFVATSFMSFCPIYWALGLSTKKEK